MTYQLKIEIALQSVSALAVGTGSGEGAVIDNSIMRNSQRLPFIPGSQVKGACRSRVTQLCNSLGLDKNILITMFGNEYQRGTLRFAHLGSIVSPDVSDFTTHIRTSVTINRQRRVAEDGLLRTIEVANDGLIYQHASAITGVIPEKTYAALLYAAMQLNSTWGHSKSRGLGWMKLLTMNVWIDEILCGHNELINELGNLSTVASTGQHQDG